MRFGGVLGRATLNEGGASAGEHARSWAALLGPAVKTAAEHAARSPGDGSARSRRADRRRG